MSNLDMVSKLSIWLGLRGWAALQQCLSHSQESVTTVDKAGISKYRLENSKRERVRNTVRDILRIHSALLRRPDLRPCSITNELLGSLVSLCTQIHDTNTVQEIFDYPGIREVAPSLRKISSDAEYCLESHWAKHVMDGRDPAEVFERLKSFPYYENYEQLTRLEICAISSVEPLPKKIAFIGSGPLPLSSLCLLSVLKGGVVADKSQPYPHQNKSKPSSDIVVLNIDRDKAAITASLGLCMKLGYRGQGMEFTCVEGGSAAQDLRDFDVVYVAGLVGLSQTEKEDIVISVTGQMKGGAIIVIRTAWGLRTCLYAEVDVTTERLLEKLDVCLVVHPYGQVVNSVIIARVKLLRK